MPAKKAPAKTTVKKAPVKKTTGKRARVKKVITQAKEPLSLLQTLREEGMANAITFLSMASSVASGAAKNFRPDAYLPQLKEVVTSLGFATSEDIERLEERIADLEQKLSEREYETLRASEEE